METLEKRSVWDQPACTSSGCSSHLSFQFGSTRRGEAKNHWASTVCQEPSQQFHCPKNPTLPYKRGRTEAHTVPTGREKGEAGHLSFQSLCSFQTQRPSLYKAIFAARLSPTPKAKIPPFEQDKHSHGKGTLCSPEEMQSRCSCRGYAGLWNRTLGWGPGPSSRQTSLPCSPQLYPTRQLE